MTELFRIEDLKVHFQARKGFLGSVVVKGAGRHLPQP